MKIETSFTVPVPPDRAWPLLIDVPRIAPCLPGASLTEDLGNHRYRGQATVKVGPVQLTFSGEATIINVDEAARSARVVAKGNDTRGRGNASANTDFVLHAVPEGTRVDVITNLQMAGAVAQYGRAAGLLKEIANQIVRQFADNLRHEIARDALAEPAPTAAGTPDAAGADAAEAAAAPSASAPPRAPVRELSAFGLLWGAVKAIVAGWFSGRKN
jgi:carbon monoxide dehydrogenase subunit G